MNNNLYLLSFYISDIYTEILKQKNKIALLIITINSLDYSSIILLCCLIILFALYIYLLGGPSTNTHLWKRVIQNKNFIKGVKVMISNVSKYNLTIKSTSSDGHSKKSLVHQSCSLSLWCTCDF